MGIRTSVSRLLAVLLCLGTVWLFTELILVPALGQKPSPPPKEEEEEAKPKQPMKGGEEEDPNAKRKSNHKVIRVGDETMPDGQTRTGDSATFDLATAARGAKNTILREFFKSLAEPHDWVSTKGNITISGGVRPRYAVRPLEEYILDKDLNVRYTGRLTLRLLREGDWTDDGKPWEVPAGSLSGVTYYERDTMIQVEKLLENTSTGLTRDEVLRAAQSALTAVLGFHTSAVEQGKRRGDGFGPLAASLRQRLLDVQIEQLQRLLAGGKTDPAKWDQAMGLAGTLTDAYTEARDQARIMTPLAAAVKMALDENGKQPGTINDEQMRTLLGRVRQIRQMFPTNSTHPLYKALQEQAKTWFEQAQSLVKSSRPEDVNKGRALLKTAEDMWPGLEGLHDYRLKLENKLSELRVGVRELPQHFMPGLAFADSEKQAVELLFESLVKLTADSDGNARWQPALADGPPKLVTLGRQFALARDAFWSNDKPVSPDDVLHTVRLLRNPNWPGYSSAWANLVDEPLGGDAARVTLTLSQGYLDPLSMMTFKVLPVEPRPGVTLTPGEEAKFDEAPVGTGPYKFKGKGKTLNGREYVSFVANPAYASRGGKFGLPRVREVQFFQTKEARSDLEKKLLDMVIDVPNSEVQSIVTTLPSVSLQTLPNRRIWFLAVNHRRPNLQKPDLRKALAHAIDRDAILTGVFRPNNLNKNLHRPLNGPFPPGSWACDPAPVFKQGLAKALMKSVEDSGLKGLKLSLIFPRDPEIQTAMEMLKKQVQETIDVTLDLEPRSLADLHKEVEVTQSYDLAYYWYDFPSQTYWLWPLFDPQATGPKGTNYLGYQNDGALTSQFGMIQSRRDFAEVKKLTHVLHGMLFEKMPLIPLWQLDTHLAMNNDLKATISDPLLVFTDVDQWRFDKK